MNTLIGWTIYGFAQAGEWLLLPLGIATGWATYRLTTRVIRRSRARRAERAAHFAVLIAEARARDAAAIAAAGDPYTHTLDQIRTLPEIPDHHRNTRKENRP